MKKQNIIFTIILLFSGVVPIAAQEQLSLSDAIAKSLENNYEILVTEGNREIASLNNSWGKAGRYPSINFNISSNNSWEETDSTGKASNSIQGGVSMNWILFDGFSVNITKASLAGLEELSEGNLAIMVENTIQSVIVAYYKILLERERLAVLKGVMKLSKDRYDYEKERKEIGSSVTYEVLQAQNSFLEDKALFLQQEVVCRNSLRDLNFVMGETEDLKYDLTEAFNVELEVFSITDLKQKMLADNKILRNQYVNLRLLDHQVKLAKRNYYPTLSVNAGVNDNWWRQKEEGKPEISGDSWLFSGNLTLSYNLFNGGNRHRALQIAKLDKEIGEVDQKSIEHQLNNQLLNLYEFYEVRKELLTVAEEAHKAAELNLQISDEKFKAGAINSFNYRDIQNIYLNAALGRLQAVYNLIDSKTSLLKITGGIISELEANE